MLYKIGDRVTLKKDNPDRNPKLFKGDSGTVVGFTEHGPENLVVLWDKTIAAQYVNSMYIPLCEQLFPEAPLRGF